jgi:uncharacterized protein (DUF2336 family)
MIVRQFLQWVRTAPAAERGDATAALARAYLYSDLTPDDRAAAEGALIMLLDDSSPIVRAELARALAFSEQAPPAVILGLAADQPEVASWVLEHSPLLLDADLVDAVATGTPHAQTAIANRGRLPCAVAAAIAEVGAAEACLVLIENPTAEPENEIRPLIRHLRESGQLNAGLILRALLSGNTAMFEEALAELSGLPIARVSALVHDKGSSGFHAVFHKAGLPASTYAAFREAVEAMREGGFAAEIGGATKLRRRMVERVLTGCADIGDLDIEPLLTLLRRFAAEAAREEARTFCEELVADAEVDRYYEQQQAA